ncbi:hypothetical protein JT366_09325 [Sphingomonas paucimobilis]|uniref:hypothetical protein n=1 Tax=Sphingomonas paucimobilis TaxID=13689 RepID=UPI001964FF83|nr:hypothetical protein [Sphingomonas paucimobilis]QRY97099.1 hypothetical protein JT366_07645 [Sphingomonas paucimobilis]QRY97266.1 hypothetical protein JT366_08625 [Sphingomonas paucimobilis]QRY97394.1 hypothetical protein JT366_09325 [Sphingomonas paucimobilis]
MRTVPRREDAVRSHGNLTDDEGAVVLGKFLQRMVDQLDLVPSNAVAKANFAIDGVIYSVRLNKVKVE